MMAGYGFGESALRNSLASLSFTDDVTGESQDIGISGKSDIIVGRSPEKCDYQISDHHVSKTHFRITSIIYEHGKENEFPPLIYCEDLGSSNGTYVNNKLIGIVGEECKGQLLIDGDIIEIRPFWKFKFHQYTPEARPWDESQEYDFDYFRDRYKVHDRVLGQGQHGSVYLAENIEQDIQIACKIVKVESKRAGYGIDKEEDDTGRALQKDILQSAQEARQEAFREIKVLSQLDHPHIINIQNAFCSRTTLYIFTDLASGGDLFSYIDSQGGNLDDPHSRVISLQIVMAIQYMHSKHVAHRDIKPENVLIKETEFGGRVMLTDFGYARTLDSKTRRMKSLLGTPGYLAPEIGRQGRTSEEGYTMAVDLWSLGMLTRCMLTGHRDIPEEWFSRVSQHDMAEIGGRIEDQQLRELWISMSSLAKKFIGKLLVVDPSQRMTATEARNHSWFTKPPSEAKLIDDRYREIIRFWKKRGNSDRIIQSLPDRAIPDLQRRSRPRLRQKLPDASAHHPMNVDRHLYQRDRLDRQALVDSLNENGTQSGSWFVPSATGTASKQSQHSQILSPNIQILSVSGNDIFSTSGKRKNKIWAGKLTSSRAESEDETQDEILECMSEEGEIDESVSTTVADQYALDTREQRPQSGNQYILWQPEDQKDSQDSERHQQERKRPRTESWDPEDRRVHSSISKRLQPFASAKTFRDAITKERSGKDTTG